MEESVVLVIFFAWIGISSLLRMCAMVFISKTMNVHPGFHYWTLSSFLNFIAMIFFMISPTGGAFHNVAYAISLLATLLLPYGLKKFGAVKSTKLFPSFTIVLLLTVLLSLILLPYSLEVKQAIIIYGSIIPIFLLSIFYINHPNSIHKELRKRLVTTTFASGVLIVCYRLYLTILDIGVSSSEDVGYLKQWVTILIDINSTCIYFGLIVLNFRKTEWDLKSANEEVTTLGGLIPICAECKRIRHDSGYWEHLEEYVASHSEATFSHGICPDCTKKLYPEFADKIENLDDC